MPTPVLLKNKTDNIIVTLTAADIASPTNAILSDLGVTYQLNVAPYTRYISNGTSLTPVSVNDINSTPTYENLELYQVFRPAGFTAAVGAAGVLTGAYIYRATYVLPDGSETEGGIFSNSGTAVNPSSQQVNLTSIPTSSDTRVTARKIYRTLAGGDNRIMYLVGTINNNTTTTFTDNVADGSLGASMPNKNTTGGTIRITSTADGTKPAVVIDNTTTSIGYANNLLGTGYNITSVGVQTLQFNTTGFNNTSMANLALNANTTGYANTGIGYQALFLNTTGYNNTAVGVGALNGAILAHDNVAVGRNSGAGSLTSGANFNTFIGPSAGGTTAFSSTNNIFIGSSAGTTNQVTSVTNTVVLGKLAFSNRSNQVVLGDDLIVETQLHGKVMIGSTTNAAANSFACLDMSVNTSLGMYMPLVSTTTRDGALASAPAGTMIFNSTTNKLNVKGASAWEAVTSV